MCFPVVVDIIFSGNSGCKLHLCYGNDSRAVVPTRTFFHVFKPRDFFFLVRERPAKVSGGAPRYLEVIFLYIALMSCHIFFLLC